MLVYAIVLILVMLVTNNPAIRAFFGRITRGFTRKKKSKEVSGNVL